MRAGARKLKRTPISRILYRQLGIPPAAGQRLQRRPDVRPHDGNVPRELADGHQEVAEEDEQPVQLDDEARERPAEEDEQDAGDEGGGALEFLAAREEGEGLFDADDEGEADEEEDLFCVLVSLGWRGAGRRRRGFCETEEGCGESKRKSGTYVAHGESVKFEG